MTTGTDHPGPLVEYTLDGAAILSLPAGEPVMEHAIQLYNEGYVNLVGHWHDVESDRDFAEYRRAE